MNGLLEEATRLARRVRDLTASVLDADVAVAPPFTALQPVAKILEGSRLALAAQNCYWEEKGAYTGEISAAMVRDLGCRYVILGHSERRQYFGETDESVNRRVRAALGQDLECIACIGEVLDDREAGRTLEVLTSQVRGGLGGLEPAEVRGITIAYEPVWAIGTGRTASAAQAQEAHAHIRKLWRELYGDEAADALRIQYGGSVKPDNAAELLNQPDVDGALVGGASLKADSFAAIVRYERG
jgi:triosephosphate isomerase